MSDYLDPIYDQVLATAQAQYQANGSVPQHLAGWQIIQGAPQPGPEIAVRQKETVPPLRALLLNHYPIVVHVFEAWVSPPTMLAPSQHPERIEALVIMLHTEQRVAVGQCPLHPATREIEKVPLIYPTQLPGKLGRALPTTH